MDFKTLIWAAAPTLAAAMLVGKLSLKKAAMVAGAAAVGSLILAKMNSGPAVAVVDVAAGGAS